MSPQSLPRTRHLALPLLLALTGALTACGQAGDETSRTAPSVSPEPTPAPVGGTGIDAPAEGDAAVLASLAAIEQNLIDVSAHGRSRNLGGTTGEFADELHAAYSRDLEKTRGLGAGAASETMRARSAGITDALDTVTEENPYRNAFMAALTREHGEALKIIDAELIPGAKSEQVRAHVIEVRSAIAERYERAQAVISSR